MLRDPLECPREQRIGRQEGDGRVAGRRAGLRLRQERLRRSAKLGRKGRSRVGVDRGPEPGA